MTEQLELTPSESSGKRISLRTLFSYSLATVFALWALYLALGTVRPDERLNLVAPPITTTDGFGTQDVQFVGAQLSALGVELKQVQQMYALHGGNPTAPELANKLDSVVNRLEQVSERVRGLERSTTSDPKAAVSVTLLENNLRNLEVRLDDKVGEFSRTVDRLFNLIYLVIAAVLAVAVPAIFRWTGDSDSKTASRRKR